MKRISIIAAALMMSVACVSQKGLENFTTYELSIIEGADSIMRVLTVRDSADLAVLRSVSSDFSAEALRSDEFARLAELMVATVTHPSQDGVGIAGPQVGLNRRVVAVQRFDKPGEPFEVYANVQILCLSDSLAYGPEGCLSVPDMRDEVLRSQEIVIEYADLQSLAEDRMLPATQATIHKDLANNKLGKDAVPTRCDTVRGFTAVIFQHEIDHLDGVLYIDRL